MGMSPAAVAFSAMGVADEGGGEGATDVHAAAKNAASIAATTAVLQCARRLLWVSIASALIGIQAARKGVCILV